MKKYENFVKSLKNLAEAIELEQPYNIAERTGIVKLFEIAYELSWKLMKELLEYHGRPAGTGSPRAILKTAYQCGMIQDEESWLSLLALRNEMAHTYSDEDSMEAIQKIRTNCLPLFLKLKEEIDENWTAEE